MVNKMFERYIVSRARKAIHLLCACSVDTGLRIFILVPLSAIFVYCHAVDALTRRTTHTADVKKKKKKKTSTAAYRLHLCARAKVFAVFLINSSALSVKFRITELTVGNWDSRAGPWKMEIMAKFGEKSAAAFRDQFFSAPAGDDRRP